MTPAEFQRKMQKYKLQSSFVVLGLILVSVLAGAFVCPRKIDTDISLKPYFTLVLGWIIFVVLVGHLATKYMLRRQGLICPGCGRVLDSFLVLRSRRCPRCDLEVIHDADASPQLRPVTPGNHPSTTPWTEP